MTIDVSVALRSAADRLDSAARFVQQGHDVDVPRFFARRATQRREQAYTQGIEHARRALAHVESAGVADAKLGVAHLTEIIEATRAGRHSTAWIPAHRVPAHFSGRAAGLRLHAQLLDEVRHGADPATIRERLRLEVEDLARRPFDQVTDTELQRVGHLAMLPDELRPQLPGTLNNLWERWRLATDAPSGFRNGIHIAGELDHIRVDGLARQMSVDPTVTREGLDAELRTILAKENVDIDAADVERISLIARMPDAKRPALIDGARTYSWFSLARMSSWQHTPTNEGAVRYTLDSMRRAVLDQALVADPSLTRERATSELIALMARPVSQLTDHELVRASALAGLPDHLRPPLPETADDATRLGATGDVLRPHGHRQLAAFAAVRTHLADHDPGAMARELVRQDRAGAAIDLELVSTLSKYPGMLDIVGIDAEFLHRQSIVALASAGGGRTDDLASSLRIARGVIERHPAGDSNVASIRAEALELADRNLARMAGQRADTYGRHPDYAEVGRFASIAALLHQMRELATQKPAPASASEVLSW